MFRSASTSSPQTGYDLSDAGDQLSILLEDGPILVVNKPAGLPTETPRGGGDSLVEWVKTYLKEKYEKPGNVYLGIPHRLDKPVSGAIVFSRNSKCAARLSEQFRERTVGKVYWAALSKRPEQSQGMLHDWIKKHATEARAVAASPEEPTAKEARLQYEIIEQETASYFLVRVELITGRMHQIRWQFASRGYPVVGDELYGGDSYGDQDRILLHARELTFQHPIRYDDVKVTAPLPKWWPEVLRQQQND
ncbi:MAG: RluA family pseudouridine synthase [Planctomycetaceae bacterium]|nr:RluA family pseudouridine synthase [Planctomycetaceae bacterium]